jgi:hypothetical protein
MALSLLNKLATKSRSRYSVQVAGLNQSQLVVSSRTSRYVASPGVAAPPRRGRPSGDGLTSLRIGGQIRPPARIVEPPVWKLGRGGACGG